MAQMTFEEFQQELLKGERFFIYLGKGYYAEVDSWNYDWLISLCSWNRSKCHACGTINHKTEYMHILIARKMGLKGQIDHEDTDPFNNREKNLREATNQQNSANSRIAKNNTTGFKGVCYYKRDNNYQASIMVNRKKIHLGYFDTAEEAHEAYCEAGRKYFGEFFNPG